MYKRIDKLLSIALRVLEEEKLSFEERRKAWLAAHALQSAKAISTAGREEKKAMINRGELPFVPPAPTRSPAMDEFFRNHGNGRLFDTRRHAVVPPPTMELPRFSDEMWSTVRPFAETSPGES